MIKIIILIIILVITLLVAINNNNLHLVGMVGASIGEYFGI